MFSLLDVRYQNILHIPQLSIEGGRITSILGESGSGKTTLLRLLNKLISPSEGSIFFQGEDISNMDSVELRRKVVMLPQTPVIFPGNLKDNLLIGLRFAGKEAVSDKNLEEILLNVKLDLNMNQDAAKLSGGEKQRLALARVLLMDPLVYLLDEPSSALDKDTEKVIINMMFENVRKNNKTLIMVTHSKEMAFKVSDEIVNIDKGQILK